MPVIGPLGLLGHASHPARQCATAAASPVSLVSVPAPTVALAPPISGSQYFPYLQLNGVAACFTSPVTAVAVVALMATLLPPLALVAHPWPPTAFPGL